MKYKLICVDIDGTLVDSYGRVTKENQEAIQRMKEKGVLFAICSGRLYYAVSMMSLYYNIPSFVICSCGAVIADTTTDEIICKRPIQKEKIRKICLIGDRYDCVIGFNKLDGVVYRGSDGVEDVLYEKTNQMYGENVGRKMVIEKIEEYREKIKEEDVLKISLWANSEEDYGKLCIDIQEIPDITVTTALKWNLEITEKEVTKWLGVEWLMKKYNIQREEIICIGDTMNDYEMVKNAGLGVAMANGDERLKAIADYVTESNDQSGVAKIITMCLEGKLG